MINVKNLERALSFILSNRHGVTVKVTLRKKDSERKDEKRCG